VLFNSIEFLLFLPLVVYSTFLVPARLRWALLLAASYFFYMSWRVEYALLILTSTVIDYFAALNIERSKNPRTRRAYLGLSLTVNLGLLIAFKYFNFISSSISSGLDLFGVPRNLPILDVLLPVGISFYTFQTLGYTIDVYRGKIAPERHLGIFALYVSFWPQLVAGPIERAQRLLPQLRATPPFDVTRAFSGFRLILWGFFKKLVIADRLALYVDAIYNNPGLYHGPPVILATVFFAFQIFCDFSGYCDIAVGSARMLGIDLMENFRRPYFAASFSDFWRRWHISLSTWFRDYVYIPLGGNRARQHRWFSNLLTTFLLSGLWHGANWTFLAWGALHGFYLIAGIVLRPWRQSLAKSLGLPSYPRLLHALRVATVFTLTCVAWVFFRARSVPDALTLLRSAIDWSHGFSILVAIPNCAIEVAISVAAIVFLELVHLAQERHGGPFDPLVRCRRPIRWAADYASILILLLLGKLGGSQFIYFQF